MWYNPIMRSLIRSPLHFTVSKNMMLMTYTGRKSGKSYTTPMNYLQIEDAVYTISSREHVWWRNLLGGTEVTLRLRGKAVPARAKTIEDPAAVAESLTRYLRAAPQLARYMKVKIRPDGAPGPDDIANLAQEMVVVRAHPK
jgi:deazaflavin-dependent oxidoreductase (nitroreductase family)